MPAAAIDAAGAVTVARARDGDIRASLHIPSQPGSSLPPIVVFVVFGGVFLDFHPLVACAARSRFTLVRQPSRFQAITKLLAVAMRLSRAFRPFFPIAEQDRGSFPG